MRRSRRNIPRRPCQIGILRNDLKRAVSRVLPKGVVVAEHRLLKLPVGRRGTRETESQIIAWRNHRVVLVEIRAAIIGEELRFGSGRILEAGDARHGMHRRDGAVGSDDQVGTKPHYVTPAATRVKRGGDQAEILRHFEDRVERSGQALGVKIRALCGGDPKLPRKAGQLEVQRLAGNLRVVSDFGDQIRPHVGRGRNAPVVHLRSGKLGHRGRGRDVLVGVLDGTGDRPMLVGMVDHAELPRPSPHQTHQIVGILTETDENIARNLRDTHPVGRHQRPGLAAQHLPLSLLHIRPEMAHAEGAAVAGHVQAGRLVAVEIPLDIAGDRHALGGVVGDGQGNARVRGAGSKLVHPARHGVTERNAGEGSRDAAPDVGGSPDRGKIHETAWSEIRPADVEGERRKGPSLVVDLG